MEPLATVWALSALALGMFSVLGAFSLITLVFLFILWPLTYFAKALWRVIMGYD